MNVWNIFPISFLLLVWCIFHCDLRTIQIRDSKAYRNCVCMQMNANLHNIWDATLNILYAHNNAFAHKNKDYFDYYSKSILKGRDMWPRCILYIVRFKFYNTLLAEHSRAELYILLHPNTITDSFVVWLGGHISHGHGQPLHANIFMKQTALYAAYRKRVLNPFKY